MADQPDMVKRISQTVPWAARAGDPARSPAERASRPRMKFFLMTHLPKETLRPGWTAGCLAAFYPGLYCKKRERSGMEPIAKVNLRQKLATFSDHWSPKVVADLNGQQV